jgi:hypothetical protein
MKKTTQRIIEKQSGNVGGNTVKTTRIRFGNTAEWASSGGVLKNGNCPIHSKRNIGEKPLIIGGISVQSVDALRGQILRSLPITGYQ